MASTYILSDNGVSSGSSGIKVTGGNDGVLILQTSTAGGTATTALTIGTNQVATFAQAPVLPSASIPQAALAANVVGNGPAFNAYASGSTSLTGGANTKVLFATSLFDTNSNYSTSTSRFTPTVAGYYSITARVRADAVANQVLNTEILKNGATVAEGSFLNTANGQQASITHGVIYMNGSTDYLEVYCYSGPQTAPTATGQSSTYFCGFLARAA